MKILCLLGSPRPTGNSATIAKRFCQKSESLGAEIKTFSLNKLTYRGCQACLTCKTKLDHCVLKDDLTEVLDAVHEADVLVLATPVYFGDITAQLKGFIDRTYSLYVPEFLTSSKPSRLSPGKRLVFIQTQNQGDTMFADIYPKYELFFLFHGFKDNILIRACNVLEKDDVKSRDDILHLTDAAAEKVCQKG
jgi:multimeric flavodoxin WrbA